MKTPAEISALAWASSSGSMRRPATAQNPNPATASTAALLAMRSESVTTAERAGAGASAVDRSLTGP